MKIKFSHIALAMITSASFSAMAEPLVAGKAVTVDAEIAIIEHSKLGLTITPFTDLIVPEIKKGRSVNVAKFKVAGNNAAVRILNTKPNSPNCTTSSGMTVSDYKVEFCLADGLGKPFEENGFTYYKANEAEYFIRSGDDNKTSGKVGADTYQVSLEAVQYRL